MLSAIQARPAGVLVPPTLSRVQKELRPGAQPPLPAGAVRRSAWPPALRAWSGRSGTAGQSAGGGTAGISAHCPDIPDAVFPLPTTAVTSNAIWSP